MLFNMQAEIQSCKSRMRSLSTVASLGGFHMPPPPLHHEYLKVFHTTASQQVNGDQVTRCFFKNVYVLWG